MAAFGGVVTAVSAVPLFQSRSRMPLLLAALAAVGTVLVANGDSANLGWFAICVLAGWCALIAGRPPAMAVLLVSALLFSSEWLFATHDPGWGAWMAGTAFTVLAALLIRHQAVLVEEMRTLQANLAQRERADE